MTKFLRKYLKIIRTIIGIGVGTFLLFDCYSIINGEMISLNVFSAILEIGMLLFLEKMYRYFMKGIIFIEIGKEETHFINLKGDNVIFDTAEVIRVINGINWYKLV